MSRAHKILIKVSVYETSFCANPSLLFSNAALGQPAAGHMAALW